MRVVWSPRAIERATAIAVHIASERPSAAGAWVDELFASVADLRHHPRRGRRVPEVGRATIREVMHGSYRVIYRLDPARLVVLTVRHGRRHWDPSEVHAAE